ncbi:hypothetical protein [Pyxidicoccus xibeiensis]|uniref:hypothetical protein n=1 Tax=Pyxidicoccus xibeiensis TaxID=2906759 RepID=UPI0020A7EA51|nr:hypothetical protein [Pyxidicoccus xibeiensis]MCP3141854.1 hypothetical protein [Pyxidicoccus xibeiensis]
MRSSSFLAVCGLGLLSLVATEARAEDCATMLQPHFNWVQTGDTNSRAYDVNVRAVSIVNVSGGGRRGLASSLTGKVTTYNPAYCRVTGGLYTCYPARINGGSPNASQVFSDRSYWTGDFAAGYQDFSAYSRDSWSISLASTGLVTLYSTTWNFTTTVTPTGCGNGVLYGFETGGTTFWSFTFENVDNTIYIK